jgi:hypothetical protein
MTIGAKFVLREQFFIISAWEVLFRLRAGPEQQLSALKKPTLIFFEQQLCQQSALMQAESLRVSG